MPILQILTTTSMPQQLYPNSKAQIYKALSQLSKQTDYEQVYECLYKAYYGDEDMFLLHFVTKFPKIFSNLKYLRLILKHKLSNCSSFITFSNSLNSIQSLSEIQIISESPIDQDMHPNWKDKLILQPNIKKLKTVARVFLRDPSSPIKQEYLSRLQKTDPICCYCTEIIDFTSQMLSEFSKIEKWLCSYLLFRSQRNGYEEFHKPLPLLPNLRDIYFSQLTMLILSFSCIEDVQCLSLMSFPLLDYLNLTHNKISEIRGLKKLNAKNMRTLELSQNMINEGNSLTQVFFQKIDWIDIEPFQNYRLQLNNPRFLAKMNFCQSERDAIIRFYSLERIAEPGFVATLKRKVLKSNIFAKLF